MADNNAELIRLYDQLLDLEKMGQEHPDEAGVYDVSAQRFGQTIIELLHDDTLRAAVEANIPIALAHLDDVALAEPGTTVSSLSSAEDAPSQEQILLGKIGLRFLGDTSEPADKVPHELPELFTGSVFDVAERIKGKRLTGVNGNTVIIADTIPQTEEENQKWLKSRPLFGEDPVDVFVAKYMSALLLFFRTSEPNSCVRIQSAVDAADGTRFEKPTHVSRYIGLEGQITGDVSVEDITITIHPHQGKAD